MHTQQSPFQLHLCMVYVPGVVHLLSLPHWVLAWRSRCRAPPPRRQSSRPQLQPPHTHIFIRKSEVGLLSTAALQIGRHRVRTASRGTPPPGALLSAGSALTWLALPTHALGKIRSYDAFTEIMASSPACWPALHPTLCVALHYGPDKSSTSWQRYVAGVSGTHAYTRVQGRGRAQCQTCVQRVRSTLHCPPPLHWHSCCCVVAALPPAWAQCMPGWHY